VSRRWLVYAFFLTPFFAAGAQHADSTASCLHPATASDAKDCADSTLRAQNAALERTYRRILASADSSRRPLLRTAQAAWESYRKAYCRYLASEFRGGSMEGLEEVSCLASEARRRTKQLERDSKNEHH